MDLGVSMVCNGYGYGYFSHLGSQGDPKLAMKGFQSARTCLSTASITTNSLADLHDPPAQQIG